MIGRPQILSKGNGTSTNVPYFGLFKSKPPLFRIQKTVRILKLIVWNEQKTFWAVWKNNQKLFKGRRV